MLKKLLCALMLILPASLWAACTGRTVLCAKAGVWINGAAMTSFSFAFPSDLLRTPRMLDAVLFVAGLATLRGHDDTETNLAWSPDGKSIASMSDDGTVRLWDASTGREVRSFDVDLESLHTVAWSPDGKTLATGGLWESDDSFARLDLWDMGTGKKLRTLRGPVMVGDFGKWTDVWSLVWSPDGKFLAFGSGDTVEIFDPGTAQRVRTLKGHQQEVKSVAWSPDGKSLASSSNDETIKLWDASTGRELRTFPAHWARSLVWSPDGKSVAWANNDKVQLLDIGTGNEIRTLDSLPVWSPDGKAAASVGSNHTVKLWDAASGKELLSLRGHTDTVNDVVWSPDGKSLASASDDRTVKLWDAASGKELHTFRFQTAP